MIMKFSSVIISLPVSSRRLRPRPRPRLGPAGAGPGPRRRARLTRSHAGSLAGGWVRRRRQPGLGRSLSAAPVTLDTAKIPARRLNLLGRIVYVTVAFGSDPGGRPDGPSRTPGTHEMDGKLSKQDVMAQIKQVTKPNRGISNIPYVLLCSCSKSFFFSNQ